MDRVDALLAPKQSTAETQWLHAGLQNGREHVAQDEVITVLAG
jgi:hypothetical protein